MGLPRTYLTTALVGALLAAGCAAGPAPAGRPDERTARLRHVLDAGTRGALDLSFSPDGALLAATGADGGVHLWSTATGRLRWSAAVLDGRTGAGIPGRRVALAPDGSTVASGHADGRVVLWSPQTGRELRTLPGASGVESLAFAPDGARLAVGGADGYARLWDLRTNEPLRALGGHRFFLMGLAFAPGGARVATGDTAGAVTLWDAASGEPVWTRELDTPVVRLAFSPRGETLAVAGWGATRLLDADSGRELRAPAHAGAAQALVFSADGTTLTAATGAGTAATWRTATGARVRAYRWRTAGPSIVALAQHGRLVAVASLVDLDTIHLWELPSQPIAPRPSDAGDRVSDRRPSRAGARRRRPHRRSLCAGNERRPQPR